MWKENEQFKITETFMPNGETNPNYTLKDYILEEHLWILQHRNILGKKNICPDLSPYFDDFNNETWKLIDHKIN